MTGAANRLVTLARRWSWLMIVTTITALGCKPSQSEVEEMLSGLLHEYVLAQEVYFAEHVKYASDVDSMTLTVPRGVTLTVVAASNRSHSALARADGAERVCAVWVGVRPPLLDYDRQAEPVCDTGARFMSWLAAREAAPQAESTAEVDVANVRPPVSTTPPVIQSGVLLGLHDWQHQSYRTVWIAGHGDSAALLASGPGLLVPRSEGFWWVNESQDCNYVVAGPAAGWPDGAVARGVDWTGAMPEECPSGHGGYQFEIFFVGPDYISIRFHGDAPSGRAVDSVDDYFVMSLDSLTQYAATPVERFFSLSTLTPFMEMVERKADSMRATRPEECGWGDTRSPPPRTWWIVRGRGRWGMVAKYRSFYWCGSFTVSASIAVPEELVGHDQLFPDWDAITAVVPTAEDAVSSPRRDLLVAQTRDSLYAFHVDGDAVGRRVLAIEARGTSIVMVQWAVGRHVQRWTDEVWELLNELSTEGAR